MSCLLWAGGSVYFSSLYQPVSRENFGAMFKNGRYHAYSSGDELVSLPLSVKTRIEGVDTLIYSCLGRTKTSPLSSDRRSLK